MTRPLLATALLLASATSALAWSRPECTRLDQGQPLCAITAWFDLHGQAGTLKVLLADDQPYLLLQHEAWRPLRGTVAVLAHVDDQPPVRRAATVKDDGVLIPLFEGDLNALANGQSVTVALPSATFTYPLVGSLEALSDLLASYAELAASNTPDRLASEARGLGRGHGERAAVCCR
jgi:hypothetical protein